MKACAACGHHAMRPGALSTLPLMCAARELYIPILVVLEGQEVLFHPICWLRAVGRGISALQE